MSDGRPKGYVRKKDNGQHRWCAGRPTEDHVGRDGLGDIWVCPDCKQVWIGVLRPSMLDAVPHLAVKWKRMCSLRAKGWLKKWEQRQSD